MKNENKGMIKVIDSYSIAPKKSLMIVKIKNENFLVALDSERTTFLTKLNSENTNTTKTTPRKRLNEHDIEEDIQKEIQDTFQEKQNRYDDTAKLRNEEIQKELQNIFQEEQNRYDDTRKSNKEAQRQFMELYGQDETEAHNMQQDDISKRRQMIRHLISELNNSKVSGSKF